MDMRKPEESPRLATHLIASYDWQESFERAKSRVSHLPSRSKLHRRMIGMGSSHCQCAGRLLPKQTVLSNHNADLGKNWMLAKMKRDPTWLSGPAKKGRRTFSKVK